MKKYLSQAGILLLSFSTLGLSSSAQPNPAREQQDNTIQGAWQVTITARLDREDCANSPVIATGSNPFESFNTFHAGGTMSEWGSRAAPASRSSGHGIWERIASGKFRYLLRFHYFDTNGQLSGTMEFLSDLSLSPTGQSFEGVARVTRTDTGGHVERYCATQIGDRIGWTEPKI